MKNNHLTRYLKKHAAMDLYNDLYRQFCYDVPLDEVYNDYLATEPEVELSQEFFRLARREFNKDMAKQDKGHGEVLTSPNEVWR